MNVTEVERKESTKHCCGNGCLRRDSAEHEEYAEALIDQRITENNNTNADRQANGLLEEIVSRGNLNRAYKRVKRNKGAGGVDGMGVDELLQYLKDNGEEIRKSIVEGEYQPQPVRRVEIPKDNGKKAETGNTHSGRPSHPAGNRTGSDPNLRTKIRRDKLRFQTKEERPRCTEEMQGIP